MGIEIATDYPAAGITVGRGPPDRQTSSSPTRPATYAIPLVLARRVPGRLPYRVTTRRFGRLRARGAEDSPRSTTCWCSGILSPALISSAIRALVNWNVNRELTRPGAVDCRQATSLVDHAHVSNHRGTPLVARRDSTSTYSVPDERPNVQSSAASWGLVKPDCPCSSRDSPSDPVSPKRPEQPGPFICTPASQARSETEPQWEWMRNVK